MLEKWMNIFFKNFQHNNIDYLPINLMEGPAYKVADRATTWAKTCNKRSHEGKEPNGKWQQLILNPEKHESEIPPSSMYLEIKNTFKVFGADLAHSSDLLVNPRSPFPYQSHCCKKAEAKDNHLLPLHGTCLNSHSKFSGHHAPTIYGFTETIKKGKTEL